MNHSSLSTVISLYKIPFPEVRKGIAFLKFRLPEETLSTGRDETVCKLTTFLGKKFEKSFALKGPSGPGTHLAGETGDRER